MHDRFVKGMVAGFTAWIPTLFINLAAKYFNLATLMYLDFAAVLIYGHRPANSLERYFALFVTIFFMSILGAVFSYVLQQLGSEYYFIKGWVFGAGVWFASYSLATMFRFPQVMTVPVKTAISNFVGASLYGIVLSYILIRWDNKIENKYNTFK